MLQQHMEQTEKKPGVCYMYRHSTIKNSGNSKNVYLLTHEKDSLSNIILKKFNGLLICHGKSEACSFI